MSSRRAIPPYPTAEPKRDTPLRNLLSSRKRGTAKSWTLRGFTPKTWRENEHAEENRRLLLIPTIRTKRDSRAQRDSPTTTGAAITLIEDLFPRSCPVWLHSSDRETET